MSILITIKALHKSVLKKLDFDKVSKSCWIFCRWPLCCSIARMCLSLLRYNNTVNRFSPVTFTSYNLQNNIPPTKENILSLCSVI